MDWILVSSELQDGPQLPIEAHRHDVEIHNRGGTIGPGKELCSQPRLKSGQCGREAVVFKLWT